MIFYGDFGATAADRALILGAIFSGNPRYWDEAYYRSRNADVVAAGIDPLNHFIDYGGRNPERRDPGPNFSTDYYFRHNPDVWNAGVNALVHYYQSGRREGRGIATVAQNAAELAGSTVAPTVHAPPPPAAPSQPAEMVAISAAVAAYASSAGFTPNPASDVVVKGSGEPIYVVTKTGRRWIPNKGTFEFLGYRLSNARNISDADLSRIPEEPPLPAADPRNLLVKKASDARVWLVTQQLSKRWIPDSDTFNVLELNWSYVKTIPDSVIDMLPTGPNVDKLTPSSWLSAAFTTLGIVFPVAVIPALLATGQTDEAVNVIRTDVAAAAQFVTGNIAGAAQTIAGGISSAVSSPPSTVPASTSTVPPGMVQPQPQVQQLQSQAQSKTVLYVGLAALAAIVLMSSKDKK